MRRNRHHPYSWPYKNYLMKLFTSEGELLSFDKFDELLGVFRVSSYNCYAAEDTNESITILLQEVRRPDYELYYITFILNKEEEFLLEVDKSHKFLCYSFLQHVQIELGREATINIAQHRFNVLPLAPCKIRIPEGPSVYLLIRIPQAAYSSKVPFKLPYSYPEQYDRIYWAADSYRHDTI